MAALWHPQHHLQPTAEISALAFHFLDDKAGLTDPMVDWHSVQHGGGRK